MKLPRDNSSYSLPTPRVLVLNCHPPPRTSAARPGRN